MAKSATPAKAKKAVPQKKAAKKITGNASAAGKVAPVNTAVKKIAKKAEKSPAPEKKEATIRIKYADKSAGQPEPVVIFDNIKKMMEPYDKKRSLVLHSKPSQAVLVSHKPIVVDGRKRDELWFVAALVQKGYVGFYYVPMYMREDLKKYFSPALLKCLKGKSCFHIKKNDPVLMAEIKKLIREGYEGYIERGLL